MSFAETVPKFRLVLIQRHGLARTSVDLQSIAIEEML